MPVISNTRGAPQGTDIAIETALPMVGSASRQDLQDTLSFADAELSKLFEDRNVLLTDGGTITFTGTTVTFTENLNLHINSQVAGGSPTIISLGSTTRTISATNKMIYAVVDRTLGTATVTDDSSTLPAVTSANQEVFLIAKRVDAGTGVKRLYLRNGNALNEGQSISLGASGSGSGSGLKNYITSPDATFTGWVASGAGVTVSTTTTSANLPENATKSTAIDILRVSGTTDYARFRFTLDVADYNKKLGVQWDQLYAGSTGDYILEMWSNTASNYGGTYTQLTLTNSTIPTGNGTFVSEFDAPASGNQYLELRIRVVSGTTNLYLSGVTVTPGTINQAPAVTAWTPFTATLVGFGAISPTLYWRRVGDSMQIMGSFQAGTVTAVLPTLTLPLGLHFDISKLSDFESNLGNYMRAPSGGGTTSIYSTANDAGFITIFNSITGSDKLSFSARSLTGSFDNDTATAIFANSDFVNFSTYSIPILEWQNAGTLNTLAQDNLTNWIAYTPDTTGSGFGAITSPLVYYRRVGDSIEIQGSFITGTTTGSTATLGLPTGLSIDFTKIGNDQIVGELQRDAAAPPFWVILNSSDTAKLYFSTTATTFAFTTGSSFGSAEYETFFTTRIPIVEYKNSQSSLVGFTEVSQGLSGLVKSAGQLLGTNTNDTAAAGYVGELLTGTTPAGNATSNSTENVCQITLTPGCWDVRGSAGVVRNAAGTLTINWVYASLSTTSATTGTNQAVIDGATTGDQRTLPAPPLRVNVPAGSTTIVYSVLFSNFTGTTAAKTGYIEAVRVR